jgi:hypothetical protein
MRRPLLVLGLLFPAALMAQSPSNRDSPNLIVAQFEEFADLFGNRLIAAFDSIPEARYTYRPTPSQQSVGYIAQHLETANYSLCERVGAAKFVRTAKDSLSDSLKAEWPKDTLVARLTASLRFCRTAINGLSEVSSPAMASTLLAYETDLAEHYSQIAVYMRLLGLTPPSALRAKQRTAITLPASTLEQFVGVYQTTDGLKFEITLRDAALSIRSLPDGLVTRLLAERAMEFFVVEVDAQFTFIRDSAGTVTAVVVHQPGRDRTAQRVR